jgi:glycine hydroxymethyltransferase
MIFRAFSYGVDRQTETINYEAVQTLAEECRPRMLVVGASAYARTLDFPKFQAIAQAVGAYLMVDIAHIAGLIAAGLHPNPCPYADFVTTTTHKSMRGPRGGMILCKEKFAKEIDKSVFPGLQGGPHMNAVAGVAITLGKAQQPAYREYCAQVMKNAQTLASALMEQGAHLITGGTENHLMVIDVVKSFGINGRVAEETLDAVSITTNKQIIPDDPNPPLRPSGIRLGTPAATTRGMKDAEMKQLAGWLVRALRNHEDQAVLKALRAEVEEMCRRYPVPGIE